MTSPPETPSTPEATPEPVASTSSDREFDVILWGATGFTGRLVAEHLFDHYGCQQSLRWALAGRNSEKLESIRDSLGKQEQREPVTHESPHPLPILEADAQDPDSLADLARRSRVICTTVGPYAKYGSELVAACAEHGTHYCDLAGEVPWMRRMIDEHQTRARESGACIVHTCGFDSIPSDLGVHFLQREFRARYGAPSPHIKYRLRRMSGGMSGGTIASMLNMLEEATRDPEVRRILANPYALNPEGMRSGPDGPDLNRPEHDSDFDAWLAPFVMAGINTRVVRRSNALLGQPYGADFRYDEAMLMGPGPAGFAKAVGLTGALGLGMAAGAIGPLRRALARTVLPSPGEGPSPAEREAGGYLIELLALHPSDPNKNMLARVSGDRDPGYGSTSRMLGEAAVCLANDEIPRDGGFTTPAAAMGDRLLDRLVANAGLSFTIEDD